MATPVVNRGKAPKCGFGFRTRRPGLMEFRTLFAVRVDELMLALGRAVGINTLGDGVAMDAQGFGGVGNALFVSRESLLDVQLFEFFEGLIQKDAAIEHVFNNGF